MAKDEKQPTREELEAEARPAIAAQLKGMPKGFTRHRGGKCPVEPGERVILVIRTAEGLGFSGPSRASDHEWKHDQHEDGLGAIIGWRLAADDDQVGAMPRRARWAE